jgi:hypothetical protein
MVEEASPHRIKTKPSARVDWAQLAGPPPSARNKYEDLDLFRGDYRQYQAGGQSALRYRRPLDPSDDSDIPEPSDVSSTASNQPDTARRQTPAKPGIKGKAVKQQSGSSRPATSREQPGRPVSRSKPYQGPTTKKIPPVNDVIRIGYSRDEKKPNETVAVLPDDDSLSSTTVSVIDPSDVSDEPSAKGKVSGHSSVKSGRAGSHKAASKHSEKHESSSKPAAKDLGAKDVDSDKHGSSSKPAAKDVVSDKHESSSKPAANDIDTNDVHSEANDPAPPEAKDMDSVKNESAAEPEAKDMDAVQFESSSKPQPPKPEPEALDSDPPDSIKSEHEDPPSSDGGSVVNEGGDSAEATLDQDDFEHSGNVSLPLVSLGDSLIAAVKGEDKDKEDLSLSDSMIDDSPQKPPADGDAFEDDFD